MKFLYYPLDKNYLSSGCGTIKHGNALSFKVDTLGEECNLILFNDKLGKEVVYKMQKVDGFFSVTISDLEVGLYFYYFVCDGLIFGRDEFLQAVNYKDLNDVQKYQLTVYKKNYKTPDWLKGGVIYQIFPDRFNRSKKIKLKAKPNMKKWGEMPDFLPDENGKILNNDFYGGNFLGIEEKLPYLKELGVTAIYLNPISKSYSNHRYDTSDYLSFDDLLGTDEQFASLVNTAEKNGIRIIFDGVYNHTGDDSVYFNKYGTYDELGAYQSKDSKYYSWYTFQKFPNLYTSWWGINVLPTINKNSKEFENFITDKVIKRYFDFGVFGTRLDVVDELPSTFVKKIRKAIKKHNPDGVLIGEVWEDATNKIAYSRRCEYFLGEELDSVMNYPLKNSLINYLTTGKTANLKQTVLEQINNYPPCALNLLMNILGTHDTERILSVLSGAKIPSDRLSASMFNLTENERELAIERLKLAFVFLFTIYGVPSIYYGDEIGFEGAKDPFNRSCMIFNGGDKNILNLVKKLSKIRSENKVFKQGETTVKYADNGVFSFIRQDDETEITVILNAGNYDFLVDCDNLEELVSGKTLTKYNLERNSYLILKRRLK
ncbi:MAG: glycoside hydrolase family 13 protein [Clostridiales bacterium]|nr:glycoside hydrolase family 13 protein [Clostridiales bacterium]